LSLSSGAKVWHGPSALRAPAPHSKSELVIEAQRASVDAFLNDGGWKLVMNS
jgi:hypothetical protein